MRALTDPDPAEVRRAVDVQRRLLRDTRYAWVKLSISEVAQASSAAMAIVAAARSAQLRLSRPLPSGPDDLNGGSSSAP